MERRDACADGRVLGGRRRDSLSGKRKLRYVRNIQWCAGYWTVVGSGANVRDSAGTGSNVLFSVSGGTKVYVTERDEYWSQVIIDGGTYYIYSPLLRQ